ncbi:hypothetical protein NEOLI_005504, partial [Neolecta irregularis DAH-3]
MLYVNILVLSVGVVLAAPLGASADFELAKRNYYNQPQYAPQNFQYGGYAQPAYDQGHNYKPQETAGAIAYQPQHTAGPIAHHPQHAAVATAHQPQHTAAPIVHQPQPNPAPEGDTGAPPPPPPKVAP